MEKKKSVKRIVNEKVTKHDVIRHCEEDKHSAVRRGNLWKECEKLFRKHAPALLPLSFRNNFSHTNCNGNPPTLTLPLKGGREQLDGKSGTSQSLINDKGLFAYWLIRLFAFSNHLTHLTHFTHFKKVAFTLAEVLITLAVIGIVAAMTIPTVMNKYNQILAETRLKLFYSTMNNAIALSEIDNGDKTTWHFEQYSPCISNAYSKDCIVPLFEKYFKPYLKIAGYEFIENFKYHKIGKSVLKVDFQNGSTVLVTYRGQDFYFYPVGSHYNDEKHQTDNKDRFLFAFYPNATNTTLKRNKYFVGKGIEAYIEDSWDGTDENLPCIKKTQLNGWKFPDDCNPFK